MSRFQLCNDFRQHVWICFTGTNDIEQSNNDRTETAQLSHILYILLPMQLRIPVNIAGLQRIILGVRLKGRPVDGTAADEDKLTSAWTYTEQIDSAGDIGGYRPFGALLTFWNVVDGC